MTGLLNWGSAFVFNKSVRGVGHLAEGRRQRAARIAGIANIARNRVIGKPKTYHGGTETRRTTEGRGSEVKSKSSLGRICIHNGYRLKRV